MIALYTFLPLYCPCCGTPTRLDQTENILRGKFEARQALGCPICGVMYQYLDRTSILRAATEGGGDLLEYYLEDDNEYP